MKNKHGVLGVSDKTKKKFNVLSSKFKVISYLCVSH